MNALFLIAILKAWSELYIYIYILCNIFFSNSDVMESRDKMVKLLVDNLIQGQLIVSPGEKIQTAAKFAV